MTEIERGDGSVVRAVNPWGGRLWRDVPTIDGRRIAPGAVTVAHSSLPLMAIDDEGHGAKIIGTITEVWTGAPGGYGTGLTELPPGEYRVGIDLGSVEVKVTEDADGELVWTVVTGELSGATVYLGAGNNPAWPEATIVVDPAPPEPERPTEEQEAECIQGEDCGGYHPWVLA